MKTFIKRNILLGTLGVISIVSSSFAQQSKLKKAEKKFDSYAYINAQEIYLEVAESGYKSGDLYQKLADTYYWNGDYSEAATWYTKSINEFPAETGAAYYLRAAQALRSAGDYSQSDALMREYASRGGDALIIERFNENRDYLNDNLGKEDLFELEPVTVNTNGSDFGTTFYGTNVIFASAGMKTEGSKDAKWNDQPYLDLFIANKDENGELSNVTPLSTSINTRYHESTPVFTGDGNTMYFTRNNFLNGKKGKDQNKTINLKLYSAVKNTDGSWGNVQELPFSSDNYSVAHPALSNDGQRLYFSSDMPGTYGKSDIWYCDILGDNSFGTPVNLGKGINTEARESFPMIDKENNLYFSTDGRPGLGGFDIFRTTLEGTAVQTMGKPFNSPYDDFSYVVDASGDYGYLSSNRRNGASSDDNIFIFRKVEKAPEQYVAEVMVIDALSRKRIKTATIKILAENLTPAAIENAGDGAAQFPATAQSQYVIRARADGYAPNEQTVVITAENPKLSYIIELQPEDGCASDDLGCKLKLNPIYFDLDKSFIRPDAEIELAKVLAALKKYPSLNIEIQSHTDSRATRQYNNSLSKRRATSTYEWLVAKGIDKDRLMYKGYGEEQLINECSDGVSCSEEQHQLNRRSMFIIQQ